MTGYPVCLYYLPLGTALIPLPSKSWEQTVGLESPQRLRLGKLLGLCLSVELDESQLHEDQNLENCFVQLIFPGFLLQCECFVYLT